jgi:hypothetical protein
MTRPATLPPPPAELAHLAAPLGAEALLALIETHGGRRLYVPARSTPALRTLLGPGPAAAFCAAFRGAYVKVPLARAWRAAIYRGRGESQAAIARRLGLTEGAVWRLLRGLDPPAASPRLPGI